MPPRFLCPPLAPDVPDDTVVRLTADESHHALRVLRLDTGDEIQLFDGAGQTAGAHIVARDGGRVTCQITHTTTTPPSNPHLTVAVALPKGPRAEDLANQLAQLGVDTLVPLVCEFGVVKVKPNKLERLERAALAAAKQCGRAHLMRIAHPMNVEEAAERAGAATHARLLDPRGDTWSPAETTPRGPGTTTVWLLVGPEGGFSEKETLAASARGVPAWRMNPHVLRIETAALAAAAVVRHATTTPGNRVF